MQSEEEKKKVTVRDEAAGVWRERFAGLKKELEAEAEGGERVVFGFVDGFLLYWDEVRPSPSALSPLHLVAPLN